MQDCVCCENTTLQQDLLTFMAYNAVNMQTKVVYRNASFSNDEILTFLYNDSTYLPSFNTMNCILTRLKTAFESYIKEDGQLITFDIESKVTIFGDLHGQFDDLIVWLKKLDLPHKKEQYLFLGDYVDRGDKDVQLILYLLMLKYKYPSQIFLLRGNHECFLQNANYGFKERCELHYGKDGAKIWKMFNEIFNTLPRCALINKKIVCMHGGLSPDFMKHEWGTSLLKLKSFKEDEGVSSNGVLTDLFWADPNPKIFNFCPNRCRRISFEFGKNVVEEFHEKFKTLCIVRAHQVVDGVKHFTKGLITVFSAPNYENCNNRGAVVTFDENLKQDVIFYEQ